MSRWSIVLIFVLTWTGCSTVPTTFQPADPVPASEFTHEAFDEVVRAHVADGQVDYPGITADRKFFLYLDLIDRVDPNDLQTREERLAFWINAYNAFAIKGILDGYSPRTTFGRYRYFIATDYSVGGEAINLYDLERKLLIPDFREPRVHFAIVCASMSCPKLQSEAFHAEDLNERLDAAARAFINDPTRNRFDRREKIAYLSKIFDWFSEDFVAHSGSLIGYVRPYVDDPGLAEDLDASSYTIEFLEYDWRLNGTPPAPEVRHARIS